VFEKAGDKAKAKMKDVKDADLECANKPLKNVLFRR